MSFAQEIGLGESSIKSDLFRFKENEIQLFSERKVEVMNESNHHVADWRRLFKASLDQDMKFFPPKRSDGKVVIPEEIIDEKVSQWKNSVVA